MKKNLALLPLAAALALPAAAEELHYNLVEFHESASVRVPHDTMHIMLEVSETAPSREAAANKVTARVNAVLARARAKSSLKAESGRRYAEANRDDKNRIRNWTDSATIFVESRDFAALSKFAADSPKEASIQNLYFSVSPEKRAKAVEEAGDIALKSFARRAQALSRSLGFSGYKIVRLNLRHSFNNIESADAGMRARAYAAAPALSLKAKAAADMQVQSGEEEVNQTVSATVQMQ